MVPSNLASSRPSAKAAQRRTCIYCRGQSARGRDGELCFPCAKKTEASRRYWEGRKALVEGLSLESLEARSRTAEQRSLRHEVEIQGLEEVAGEDLGRAVAGIASLLGVAPDTDGVRRLPGSPNRPRSVSVRFASLTLRRSWLLNRKKTVLTNDDVLGNGNESRIYLNEMLTPYYRRLYCFTKTVAKELGYRHVWVKEGVVNVRRTNNSAVLRIRSIFDLDRLHMSAQPGIRHNWT